MTIVVPDISTLETAPRPRSAIAEFVHQQPLGTVSFVIICRDDVRRNLR